MGSVADASRRRADEPWPAAAAPARRPSPEQQLGPGLIQPPEPSYKPQKAITGSRAAFADFMDKGNKEWVNGELYVIVATKDGIFKAHAINPKLIDNLDLPSGQNLTDESRDGFPRPAGCASLGDARRNYRRSERRRP